MGNRDEIVDRLSSTIARGEAVLFLGAGVSATAGAPVWSEFTAELRAELTPPTAQTDPLLVAQFFRNQFGDHELVTRIRRRLTGPHLRPSTAHELLAALKVRVFITTNFDSLIEDALRNAGHRVHVICDDDDLALWNEQEEIQVVKLHGDLDRPRSLIISRDDYARRLGGTSALGRKLLDIFWHRPVVFLGYSMRDPDIDVLYQTVLTSLGELKHPAFLLTDETDPHMLREWGRRRLAVALLTGPKTESLTRLLTQLVSASRARGNGILVVEDDVAISAMLCAFLKQQFPSIPIRSAKEGFEALMLMSRERPVLILLDLLMPGMNGVELIAALARDQELCVTKIIIVSAHSGMASHPEVVGAPNVLGFIEKPFNLEDLVARVRRAIY